MLIPLVPLGIWHPSVLLSGTLLAPMLVDWSVQQFAGRTSTNTRRFITGVLGGIGYGSLWFHGVAALVSMIS